MFYYSILSWCCSIHYKRATRDCSFKYPHILYFLVLFLSNMSCPPYTIHHILSNMSYQLSTIQLVLSTMSYPTCPIHHFLLTTSYSPCPIQYFLSTISIQPCPIHNIISTMSYPLLPSTMTYPQFLIQHVLFNIYYYKSNPSCLIHNILSAMSYQPGWI